MAIFDIVRMTKSPATRTSLEHEFKTLGLEPGEIVLLHSSLASLGWVCGGANAVIDAILNVLGPKGTLMVPTHTATNSDPANWSNPRVPTAWHALIRREMVPFSPEKTPSVHMGKIAETFRGYPGVLRSHHPIGSFAAHGPDAAALVDHHELNEMFGDHSPLGALYRLDGRILLLGVGHTRNTSLHLAESRAEWPGKSYRHEGAMVEVEGGARWVTMNMTAWNDEDFSTIGHAYDHLHEHQAGRVGCGRGALYRQTHLVDFAAAWMERNRGVHTED
ncbi:MAG: AAC(3) family N-acetyltransferase [Myxococcota bacterium]|nr:AAC(3) family N-acetyltransferase [Myxococcota bacterium]